MTNIREARVNDAEQIAKIYNYYIQESIITFEEKDISAQEIIKRMNSSKKSALPWLVADIKGQLAGYCYANLWNERSAYRYSVETTIYLSYDYQSQGWGTKLYQVLFTKLRQQSYHTVIAGITLPNPASIALHQKFGMLQVAHYREVGYKCDRWLDVGYWQVQLNN